MDTISPSIGHNAPPDENAELRARLEQTHQPLIERQRELLDMESRLPAEMDDDWEARIIAGIKSCTKYIRNCETTRLDANEPWRAKIAVTDGFFKGLSDKVDKLKTRLTKEYLTPYQQKKANAEKARREAEAAEARRRQEEEARKAREEANRLAEIKRKEREAKEAQERAERERREAEERQREAERLAAEAKNRREREAAAKAKADAERLEREAAEAARKAEEDKRRVERERQEQEAEAKKAREDAERAKAEQAAAEKSAGAKAADMSRTRTDLGAIGSLRTVWKHRVVDPDKVPRIYCRVHEPAIVAAIRASTDKDGKCDLTIPGVEIFPVTDSVVR